MSTTQIEERAGSNGGIFGIDTSRKPSKSKFDLSRKNNTTVDIGGIYPIDVFQCVPGDSFKISVNYQLDAFPMVVPPMTNYKVVTHWYYCRYKDLWKGAETYLTKGRSGTIELEKPKMTFKRLNGSSATRCNVPSLSGNECELTAPMGLPSYLSRFINAYTGSNPSGSDFGNYLPYALASKSLNKPERLSNAMLYLMYQKIYRDNYCPINLMQNNKIWFPDDISGDEWRLNYDGSNLVDGCFVPSGQTVPAVADRKADFVPSSDSVNGDTCVHLGMLRYDTYDIDAFVSAKPFITRGLQETAGMDITGLSATTSLDFTPALASTSDTPSKFFTGGTSSTEGAMSFLGVDKNANALYGLGVSSNSFNTGSSGHPVNQTVHLATALAKVTASTTFGSGARANLTANNLRNMLAYSVFKEINSQTNGNYRSTVRAHFGVSPNGDDFEPKYIGGTSDFIQFSQILQTSATTESSAQGNPAGIGQIRSKGYVGDFFADDYGYIMGVMIIRPEVNYTQGQDRIDSEFSPDQEYWPEFAELGYQPILNKEVYWSGDAEKDDDLFGWQTRYYYLKSRPNIATGLMALDSNTDSIASAYTQSREFNDTPKLSNQFVSMSPANTRRDMLAYPKQPMFRLQCATELSAVRALPYSCQPNTFGF